MTELPPSLHTSVNSARFNPLIDVSAMSGLERWSLPWHSLQRTLAKGLGRELASDSQACGSPAASWLARAQLAHR